MTSAAKIAANRRNAQKSTGPRGVAAKARTRRNAFRHGLAIPIREDAIMAAQRAPLEAALAIDAKDPCGREAARIAAAAQLEIERVRRVKVDMLEQKARQINAASLAALSQQERTSLAFARKSETLVAFDRYERRALSRRNRALRQLSQLARTAVEPEPARTAAAHYCERQVFSFLSGTPSGI